MTSKTKKELIVVAALLINTLFCIGVIFAVGYIIDWWQGK
jgi:hypothetical protein